MRKLTYKQPGNYMGWDITMYDDHIHILMRTPLGNNQVVYLPIKIFNKMIKEAES